MARATPFIVTSIALLATAACTSPTESFETLEIVTEVLPALEPGEEYSEVLEAVGGDGSHVAAEHPEIVAKLQERAEAARKDIGDFNQVGSGARFYDPPPRRTDIKKLSQSRN